MLDQDNEPVEFTATLVHETEHALKLRDGELEFWMPKSQCRQTSNGKWEAPHWLAEQKGLV
jgi:hypothetical protein